MGRLVTADPASNVHIPFPNGCDEMADLVATFDWQATPLGPIDTWPESRRSTVRLLLNSPVPIVTLWGEDGIMIYNAAYARFAAGRHPALFGSKVREGWPEVAAFNDNVMKVGLAGRTLSYKGHSLTLHRSGRPEQVWMDLDYSPILDETGRPVGVMAIVVETTQRVQAEERLAEHARTLALLNQTGAALAAELDPDRVIQQVTDAGVALTGAEFGAFFYNEVGESGQSYRLFALSGVDRSHFEKFPPPRNTTLFASTFSGERVVRSDDITADPRYGQHGPYYGMPPGHLPVRSYMAVPVVSRSSQVIGALFFGHSRVGRFTRQHEELMVGIAAQAAIATENARLFRTIQQLNETLETRVAEGMAERDRVWRVSQDAFVVANYDGIYVNVSPAFERILGWPESEILGKPIVHLLHPDDIDRTERELGNLSQGQTTFRFENRFRHRDGEYRWLSWTAVPEAGLIYAVARDVTEDKERQEALLATEEQLRQAQKMEAVGQLTGGLAHDFNNLLTGIGGSLEVIQARVAKGRVNEIERYIVAARGATERAAALTHRLLAFSRRQTLDPKATDVNMLVEGMEELIRRTVGPSVSLEVTTDSGLWTTMIDPNQLESALLNLCINARDAMPDGGELTIATTNCAFNAAAARLRELPPGQYISVAVTDTGSGMTPDVLARAFDPFFTTKPIGLGTGLGLSMIYGFAQQSGGQVRIQSSPEQGTTVALLLPRYVGEPEVTELHLDVLEAPRAERGERVLVVDDEPTVRMLVTDVLDELGYAAIEADDSTSALQALQSNVPFDLMVTDVGLPNGLNGRQLADAARESRPQLKILFITGYAESAVVGHGRLAPGMHVMSKPFTMEALASRIKTIIQEG